MLPHQGQGCGQSVEDAEAIQAFFEGVNHSLSTGEVTKRLQVGSFPPHERLQVTHPFRAERTGSVQIQNRSFFDNPALFPTTGNASSGWSRWYSLVSHFGVPCLAI